MKKYIRYTLCVLCLLSLCTLGLWELVCGEKDERISTDENRMLQAFPALSGGSVLSGGFMKDFESWMSDAFPMRAGAVRLSERLLGVFGETDENQEIQAALDAEEIPDTHAEETASPEAPVPSAAAPAQTGAEEESPAEERRADGRIWMVSNDGSTDVQISYSYESLTRTAEVIDLYRDALPEDGSVQFIHVPTSYMGKLLYYGRASGWGYDVDDVLRPLVEDGVSVYDPTEIFGEDVYTQPLFSGMGDHHWFPRGAWMAASDMLRSQGLIPTEYYEYPYRLESTGKDTVYTAEQLLAMSADKRMGDIEVMVPLSPVESYIVRNRT